MNKRMIAAACLLLASSSALAAKAMTTCTPPHVDPRAPAEIRARVSMACAQFNAGRSCEKQASEMSLGGTAKRDYMDRCMKEAINRHEWQKR